MKGIEEEVITAKLNSPGFYEGIIIANKLFEFKSYNHFQKHWRYIKQYLSLYEVPVEGEESKAINFKPFKTDEDFEIAKHVMLNLYN
ncbi:hypothetical protein [Mucilaginibacter aquaedulcis]|uniref:hypothetical protein n=1 Tax=Mucilaginibacter aquaedulcis TaxID=1187081 RepID=UPI0025B309B5|nr:hypothetical protein [Mucilaginibacter aquaedulcis]MDN3551609.1 hypothetical protein [Mucilaginibacter aquaedulcis]